MSDSSLTLHPELARDDDEAGEFALPRFAPESLDSDGEHDSYDTQILAALVSP